MFCVIVIEVPDTALTVTNDDIPLCSIAAFKFAAPLSEPALEKSVALVVLACAVNVADVVADPPACNARIVIALPAVGALEKLRTTEAAVEFVFNIPYSPAGEFIL